MTHGGPADAELAAHPARDHRTQRAVPAPAAHQPGLRGRAAVRHARGDARICDWIQRIAAYERAPQKYHHTVSRAWVEIVAHHVDADPDCADFDTFAARHPALLDKRLLSRHYRSSTLAAAPARRGWVEPDLLPFPWSPAQDSRAG